MSESVYPCVGLQATDYKTGVCILRSMLQVKYAEQANEY